MFTLSRTARITLLLVIDVLFFFVELIVGYAVGSLALVADSFHMLNDVLSLIVALYAIRLTGQTSDHRYTYGWHRAEILAALVNGVFLLALCFSIALEALGRLFTTPEISSAQVIVIVGSLGLLSNIVGLFLFHEHGHSHGPGDDHGHAEPTSSHAPPVTNGAHDHTHISSPVEIKPASQPSRDIDEASPSLSGHPAFTRASLVQVANDIASQAARSPSPVRAVGGRRSTSRPPHVHGDSPHTGHTHAGHDDDEDDARPSRILEETTPLLSSPVEAGSSHTHTHGPSPSRGESAQGHGHGHSHGGSMNMHALLLHVLGDALGNVGVIATGLVIWLTEWKYKFYFDPLVSLLITVIIFSSALPLVRSTSYILLQGVPTTISLEEVRSAILSVDGVLSVHELHVWQLSESKVVASVHITASRKFDFMTVAAQVREQLHKHGIHSCTIQPEYHEERNAPPDDALKTTADTSCLVPCPPDQACSSENACCPPAVPAGEA